MLKGVEVLNIFNSVFIFFVFSIFGSLCLSCGVLIWMDGFVFVVFFFSKNWWKDLVEVICFVIVLDDFCWLFKYFRKLMMWSFVILLNDFSCFICFKYWVYFFKFCLYELIVFFVSFCFIIK